MTTATHFEKNIQDQDGKSLLNFEFGVSSYFEINKEPGVYLNINNNFLIMDQGTAKQLIEAFVAAGKVSGITDPLKAMKQICFNGENTNTVNEPE